MIFQCISLSFCFPPTPSIGPFFSTNRSSCSSKGAALTRRHVPKNMLNDILKRRAEEYRQHRLRFIWLSNLFISPVYSSISRTVVSFQTKYLSVHHSISVSCLPLPFLHAWNIYLWLRTDLTTLFLSKNARNSFKRLWSLYRRLYQKR